MLEHYFKPTTVNHWGSVYGAIVAESASSLPTTLNVNLHKHLRKELGSHDDGELEAAGSSKMCQKVYTSAQPRLSVLQYSLEESTAYLSSGKSLPP